MSNAVYILFGRTGSGKSHIAGLLEERGVFHVDGDKHITSEMRKCLEKDEQMTPEMINVFVQELIFLIKEYQANKGEDFIVSQALYLNKHRQEILDAIPEAKFVHICVDEDIRARRIQHRFNTGLSKVSLPYAIEMDKHFEKPTHEVIEINNNQENKKLLTDEVMAQLHLNPLPAAIENQEFRLSF